MAEIWFKTPDLDTLNAMADGCMVAHLGIKLIEVGNDYMCGTMPVDHRTHQPYGILHGGASIALAETLGSIAAHHAVDSSKYLTVGMEINGNHIRPVKNGIVKGTARAIHLGRTSHIWSIEIENEQGKLVCVSRITMAVVPKEKI